MEVFKAPRKVGITALIVSVAMTLSLAGRLNGQEPSEFFSPSDLDKAFSESVVESCKTFDLVGCSQADCGCGDSCCSGISCGCGCGCCSSCGTYYGMAEFIAYHRDNSSASRPILEDSGFNPVLLTDDLSFDYEPGIRARIGRTNGPCCHCDALELEYLGIFDWNGSTRVVDENNIFLPGALGFAVNGFLPADAVDVDYNSELHSLELNCVRCCCQCCCCCRVQRFDVICGLRYLRLGEDLRLSSDNFASPPAVDAVYDVNVDNDLYGAQIGGRYTSWRNRRVGLECFCKAGIYGNDARQSQFITDNIGATPVDLRPLTGARDGAVAFVGELGIIPKYRINDVWSLRGGYNILWIEGVALAPDQLDFTDTPTSGQFIDTSGGVFAHGFSAGCEARF